MTERWPKVPVSVQIITIDTTTASANPIEVNANGTSLVILEDDTSPYAAFFIQPDTLNAGKIPMNAGGGGNGCIGWNNMLFERYYVSWPADATNPNTHNLYIATFSDSPILPARLLR